MVMMTRELERGLVEAGVPEAQAERVADAMGEQLDQLATKGDIRDVRAEMRAMKEDLLDRLDAMERTMWRLAWLGFAMWSATFGALMYAVFG